MSRIDEQASARFRRWEERARGWQVHPHAVAPEPPFTPFTLGGFDDHPVIDDARKPGLLTSLVRKFTGSNPLSQTNAETKKEPNVDALERGELVELPLGLPPSFTAKPDEFAQFVTSLSYLAEPVAF